jgi:hypothetical protein
VQRLSGDERLELGDQLAAGAEREVCVYAFHDRHQPELLPSADPDL